MFNLALTSSTETNKIYMKVAGENRKIDQRWEDFHKALFEQPEFDGLEGS